MVNINNLKGKIIERQSTGEILASEIGINKSTLYRKFKKGGDTFEIWEVQKIVEILKLTDEEIKDIFLATKVRNCTKTTNLGGNNMEKKQTTLRLPVDLYERIQQEAERKNMPMQDLITSILWETLIENTAQE